MGNRSGPARQSDYGHWGTDLKDELVGAGCRSACGTGCWLLSVDHGKPQEPSFGALRTWDW